jgi:hypothetical protein
MGTWCEKLFGGTTQGALGVPAEEKAPDAHHDGDEDPEVSEGLAHRDPRELPPGAAPANREQKDQDMVSTGESLCYT